MVYAWSKGTRLKIPAQVAGEALDAIRAKHGGELEPSVVVEASRRKTHPLHSCFEWNDSKAGQLYREAQARLLIRSVRVVRQGSSKPTRVYVNVTTEQGRRYIPTSVAMSNKATRRQALKEAMALLNGVKERLSDLQNIGGITSAINLLETEIQKELKGGSRKKITATSKRKKKARPQSHASLRS